MAFGILGKKDSSALGSPQLTNSWLRMLNSLLSSRLVPIMTGTWFHEGRAARQECPQDEWQLHQERLESCQRQWVERSLQHRVIRVASTSKSALMSAEDSDRCRVAASCDRLLSRSGRVVR